MVDWSQDPFTVVGKVHDSPDAPTVTIRYFITNLPPVEGVTLFGNRIFESNDVEVPPVGPYPPWCADWKQDGARPAPVGLNGAHLCHPEWLKEGEPWPPTEPDTIYNGQGIPVCCLPGQDVLEGGYEFGGEWGDVHVYTDAPEGGYEFGGEWGDFINYTDAPEGGYEFGGEWGDVYSGVDETEGGFEFGGEWGDVLVSTDATEGGFEFGGEWGDIQDYTDATEGGFEFGGEWGDSYLPPAAPGPACIAAGNIAVGQSYTGAAPVTPNVDWFKFPEVNGTSYTVTFTATGGAGATVVAHHGTCAGLLLIFAPAPAPATKNWTAAATDNAFLQVTAPVGGITYTISLASP